ncbi:MAG: DNA mismatch repair endonuclease MutL [Bacteroidaceae bacterium]|nr:DNA mismatch repair endonuclease MutL [Bacteroidaceae bacterium]
MPDIIRLLPDTVANQIAAGEVIQRPASVVKELVENAVDAGASMVQVVIEEAGKTLVQVIDDGCGMSVTDARLAFERHATSKIRQADDLFALRTMGFRGEALPSIAAVAQVELRTRTADEELGTRLFIEAGKVRSTEAVSTPRGSNFAVRNLFFNIPARRRFLKSNQTEMGNILTEFERLAMAHTDVAFRLYRDGALLYDLPAGTFKHRITDLFGRRIDKQLVPVNVETDLVKISGFTGTPESARRKRPPQFFFANDRYMRHLYFARAVLTAYERLVPEGEQVPFFLRFEVDPAKIDVNIHPTKTEIKFQEEQTLWQIILAAVREALGKFGGVPTIDFDTAGLPDIPLFIPPKATASGTMSAVSQNLPEMPHLTTDPDYNPFGPPESGDDGTSGAEYDLTGSRSGGAGTMPIHFPDATGTDVHGDGQLSFASTRAGETTSEYLQYHGRYIVCAVHSGLMLIDQHRAHMRILYDRYLRCLNEQTAVSQGLLFPQPIDLPPSEAAMLAGLQPALTRLGFELRENDGSGMLIYGVPAGTEGLEPEHLLRGILDEAGSGNDNAAETINHRLALALARRAALPVGQVLSAEEMSSICAKLFAGATPNYAPDGTPTFLILEDDQLTCFFDTNH